MTIIKGLLKDKLGNQLYPETSFDQVKDDDGKTLKVWRGEIDGKVTTYDGLLGPDGNIKLEKLPEVLSKFKGSFANAEALPKEGTAGDYAICTDTDTVWVWDAEKTGAPGWIDTGKKGNVTSVNGKTGDLTIELADLGVTISAADINGLPAKVDTKVATADIIDNVTSADANKPLSANQGKVLDGKITALSGVVDTKVATASIVNDLATGGAAVPLSAEQGKVLDGKVSAAATKAAEVDFAVVENGAQAPATLREGGMYFEKASA